MARKTLADEFQAAQRLHAQGQLDDAQRRYRRILSDDPRHFEARFYLGIVRLQQGRFTDAVGEFRTAVSVQPTDANAWTNLGFAELKAGNKASALEAFDKAVELKPSRALSHNNRGNILRELKRPEEALLSYDRALALDPNYAEAHNNRGIGMMEMQRWDDALAGFDRALALNPDYGEAHANRGNALLELKRPEDALVAYERAMALKGISAELQCQRGVAHKHMLKAYEAIEDFEKALALKPDFVDPAMELEVVLGQICDWREPPPQVKKISEEISFRNLALRDDPEHHLAVVRQQVRKLMPETATVMWRKHPPRDKIRLAYLSADFGNHVVAVLTFEVFELHDRTRFEVIGFAANPHEDTPARRRLEKGFDRFIDVTTLSHRALAERIAEEEIDILVDLGGHTGNSRIMALAYRPAPIQLSWLGYPASTGAPFVDYTFADTNAMPDGSDRFFSEKLAYLPDTYQSNDRKRAIAEQIPTRAECGLPEDAFVFCSFNAFYKYNPSVFDVWMRLLTGLPGSVLWLVGDNPFAIDNLCKEAERRGVDAKSRLIFAERIPAPDNLARMRLADLFLDTWPYNAGATASDALWAGLPVLTYAGRGFTARMACSVLHAIGLPELVTYSIPDYEARALHLAMHAGELKALRERLARNRDTFPLFDTPRFVRHMEAAYETMWRIHQAGEPPRMFHVDPIEGPSEQDAPTG